MKFKEAKMKVLNLLALIIGTLMFFISQSVLAITFNMAPLEFTNRAGCAALSQKPARSVFLQIDAFNAGKAGFAQGIEIQRSTPNTDPAIKGQLAAHEFRLWSTHLAFNIIEALKTGKLPLLNEDGSSPAIYKNAVDKCLLKKQFLSCKTMNEMLSEMWSRSKMKSPHWQELGLNESNFFPKSLQTNAAIGCHIVRKFSAFHSPLKTQEVENGTISNIAIEAFKPENSLDSCFSTQDGKDPRFTTVQLDIANIANEKDWDQFGFEFWHSFKLFYSWAWRYAPEYTEEYGSLKQSFSSIAFEDSVMLLPNGCRSIELPKCDSDGLNSDVLRAAKFLGTTHPAISELPPKPIDALFSGKAEAVNNDALGLFKAENASSWSRDFKDKLSALRFDMQRKLNTGISKLQIITNLINVEDVNQDIAQVLADSNYDRNETYLSCMEFTLAKNNLFADIDAEIQSLNNTQELQSILLADTGKNLKNYVEYYKSLASTMENFCKQLEVRGRATAANNDPDMFKSLNEWAFDILRPNEKNAYQGQCLQNPNHPACPKNLDKKFLVTRPHQTRGNGDEFTICKTSLECARIVLDSLVSVISVRRYAHAFLPLDNIMSSPDLFNNYASPTACHLYDPWSKQRNSWKLFVADLGSALLEGASCGAFKFNVLELPKDEVIGFKEIQEQEQVNYSAITKHDTMKYIAGVDYSFLPGLTCGAAVSNMIINQQTINIRPGYYAEMQVNACDGKSNTEYTIDRNVKLDPHLNKVVKTDKNISQTCFRCSIGLSALAQNACVVPLVGQIAATGVGLFQGVMRLVSNLEDKDNIIKTSELNIDQISESYKNSQTMLPECHKKLKKGITCVAKKVKQ